MKRKDDAGLLWATVTTNLGRGTFLFSSQGSEILYIPTNIASCRSPQQKQSSYPLDICQMPPLSQSAVWAISMAASGRFHISSLNYVRVLGKSDSLIDLSGYSSVCSHSYRKSIECQKCQSSHSLTPQTRYESYVEPSMHPLGHQNTGLYKSWSEKGPIITGQYNCKKNIRSIFFLCHVYLSPVSSDHCLYHFLYHYLYLVEK